MTSTQTKQFVSLWVSVLISTLVVSCKPAPVYQRVDNNSNISVSRQNAITKAVELCSPAIVGINVTEIREQIVRDPFSYWDDPIFERFFGQRGYRRQYKVKGVGSGFLISHDGYILTNDHVAGNASKVVVTMTDGSKHDAQVVGHDLVTDVALLKIEGSGLPFLKLSNSDKVKVGEWAIAFGNPFGLFDINAKPTVTVGVMSNVGVSFTQSDDNGDQRVYRNMIQTDAAISSGNSGGPLINADGEVVGINTVIYSTSQDDRGAGSIGIGFAIPINRVINIVDRLRNNTTIDRNFWTGLKVVPIDEETSQYYGIQRQDGVLITRVSGDSPANDAGIEPGDVVVAGDGQRVQGIDDLNVVIFDGEVGKKLHFTIDRGGRTVELDLLLTKPPGRGIRN